MTRAGVAPHVAAVALGTALFVLVQAAFAAVADPARLYAPDAEAVLPASRLPVPGGRALDPATVTALVASPLAREALPETFTFAIVRGEPVVARGADLADLLALHRARLVAGAMPVSANDSALLVGERLAARLGLAPGDVVAIPASIQPDVVVLRVGGLVAAETALADELLVDLASGRRLGGLAPGAAHLVEIVPLDRERLREAVRATLLEADRIVVAGPAWGRAGEMVTLRVTDGDGNPLAAVRLTDGASSALTDARGEARVALAAGRATWTATGAGRAPVSHAVFGAGPDDGVVVARIALASTVVDPGGRVLVEAELVNFAAEPRAGAHDVRLDGVPVASLAYRLSPGAREVLRATFDARAPGDRIVAVADLAAPLLVATPEVARAQWRLIAGGAPLATASSGEAVGAVFGSVALAGVLVSLLSFALFFVGNAAVFSRLAAARAADLALLSALGATRRQVRAFARRALAPAAVAAALAGVALGAAAAEALAGLDAFAVFGHRPAVSLEPARFAVLAAFALLSTLGAAEVAAERLARPRPPASRRPARADLAEALA
ncbi:MAG TPA: FtsX-like permease family protein [Candidatus Thermoplasmatota archaeon]|nr:FtsX-like permease family protein [Candidatus Thermoplasmatota archaeon]